MGFISDNDGDSGDNDDDELLLQNGRPTKEV